MITSEIIKIASNTRNVGCTNKYNYKSNIKNPLCGDKIKIELKVKKTKIYSMKYETESCVYCEASASLLAKKIKNIEIYAAQKQLNLLKKVLKNENIKFPKHFQDFKILINKKNLNRINCINLPCDPVLKALR